MFESLEVSFEILISVRCRRQQGDKMKNEYFDIQFNDKKGTIISVINPADGTGMNWCDPVAEREWGQVLNENRESERHSIPMEMVSFRENGNTAETIWANGKLEVMVKRFFAETGNFVEEYHVKNLRRDELFLERGELGVCVPFNDRYTQAEDCLLHRCNAHIWCGGHTSWVNALRMGKSGINLGLVLTKGELDSYSISRLGKEGYGNLRGSFILNCGHTQLCAGEEFVFSWELFWHEGNEDFYRKARLSPQFMDVRAEHFTVFPNEKMRFTVLIPPGRKNVSVSLDGHRVPFAREGNLISAAVRPQGKGEHRFRIEADGIKTHADFLAVSDPMRLAEKRVAFLVEKQQYHCPRSRLDGAFLIYDNREGNPVYDAVITDHNACRERVGMALLLIKYLQKSGDESLQGALEDYIAFLYREFLDGESGEVYNGVGKDKSCIRLYNAPWITLLLTELYFLRGQKEYLVQVLRILERYYRQGGKKFYPNGLSMAKTIRAFREAGMEEEAGRALELFTAHVENMISNGLAYPKHEVNFEQTIVTSPANYISEIGLLTGEERYAAEAKKHIEVLERFNGRQPGFHQYEIPIRYWDDFWFGKGRLFGDTFPHYWSSLTARAYLNYYRLSGDAVYKRAAQECMRNCLCLFTEEGQASCAYVFPFRIDDRRGEFYDEWANDQDYALYFFLDYAEELLS